MKINTKNSLIILSFLLLAGVLNYANSDEIYLNDGRTLVGKVISQEGEEVEFSLGRSGAITTKFKRSDIKAVAIKPLPPEEPKKEPQRYVEPEKPSQPAEFVRQKEIPPPEPPKKEEAPAPAPKIINDSLYILYIPGGLNYQKKHPLVIALSPAADAQSMINAWKPAAEKHDWIILASKKFQNGKPASPVLDELASAVSRLCDKYPISKTNVIASGFSGGGMGSHWFAFEHPELIKAVVINTGMIYEKFISQKSNYPRNKLAVFIASSSDFRYDEMKRDKKFLEDLGWKTKWIEFGGGHILAPASMYEKAAEWLEGQLDKPEAKRVKSLLDGH